MAGYRVFIESDLDNWKYLISYYHYPNRWHENLLPIGDNISDQINWSSEIKFLNITNDDLSDDIKNISTEHGGIYIFYLKGVNLPFVENYILYVGRCLYSDRQNLRKRAREYLEPKRIPIQNMFKRWRPYIYYRYYRETDNDRIKALETILIRSIVPPFNEVIPNRLEVQPTVNAFN